MIGCEILLPPGGLFLLGNYPSDPCLHPVRKYEQMVPALYYGY